MKKRFLSIVLILAFVFTTLSGFSTVYADGGTLGDVLQQKFAGKDKLNVCFIGGSITEGTGATELDKSYASLVAKHLEDVSPISVEYFNAGIGGTGSDFGVLRLNHDVLQYNPDIVFVEFAINDVGTPADEVKKNMEGIVRQIRAKNEKTAIVFIYTTNTEKAAVTALHDEVANYYGICAINIQDYVWGLSEGISGYLKDGVHPNDDGHKLYADYIISQLDNNAENVITFAADKAANFGSEYASPRFADMTEWNLSDGDTAIVRNRKVLKLENGKEVSVNFSGKVIGAYPVEPTAENSVLTYKIDNGEEKTLNLQNKRWFYVFGNNLAEGDHTLTLKAETTGNVYIGNFMVDDGNAQYSDYNSAVTNPGFETVDGGRDAGWDFAVDSLSNISSDDKNSGDKALKLVGIGNSISQVIKVKPNTTYSLSLFAKFSENSESGKTNFTVKVNNSTADNTRYNVVNETVKASTGTLAGFRHISYTFTTGKAESIKIVFAANDPDSEPTKAVYIDDVAVTEHGTYLIENNGFENGLVSWYNQNDIAVVKADPDDASNHAAYVEGGNQILSQTINVEKNTDYIVSFNYKNDSPLSQTGEFQVQNINKANISNVKLTSKSAWSTASVNFNSGDNEKVILSMYTASNVNAYYDDFYIIKSVTGEIANGDFESGALGWNLKDGATIVKSENNAYMKHHIDNKSVYMERTVTVLPETNYLFTFRYKVDRLNNGDSKAFETGINGVTIKVTELTDDWKYGSVSFSSGSNTSAKLTIYTGPDATVLYDDFKLIKTETGDIVNGDFETGFIGWRDDSKTSMTASEGDNTYLLQNNAAAQYILNKVQLPYDGKYTLSFRYAVADGKDGDKLAVITINGQEIKIFNNTSGWCEKEVEFAGKQGENVLSVWTAANVTGKYDDFVIKYFKIDTVSDAENQKVGFTVTNKSGEEKQVTFIVAYYNADKSELIKVAAINPQIYANRTSDTYTYSVEGEKTGTVLKVFAFDNLTSITPLGEYGEITVK